MVNIDWLAFHRRLHCAETLSGQVDTVTVDPAAVTATGKAIAGA